jgi:hypothetical protein
MSNSTSTLSLREQLGITTTPRICKEGGEGIFLPFDSDGELELDDGVRAFIYVMLLGWFFLGVAISSDAFMNGIEKITSSKTRVKHPSDPERTVRRRLLTYYDK